MRVKLLTISDSEPLRSTMICSGSPEEAERGAQPVDQRQNRQQHGHRERDAQRRHDRGGLADHQIAKIVCDRNGHGG